MGECVYERFILFSVRRLKFRRGRPSDFHETETGAASEARQGVSHEEPLADGKSPSLPAGDAANVVLGERFLENFRR